MLQCNVVVGAELLHRSGFRGAPDDGFDDSSGQPSVLVEFEMVALHVGDTEEAGDGQRLDGQRRRGQHHGMPALLMRLEDVMHV